MKTILNLEPEEMEIVEELRHKLGITRNKLLRHAIRYAFGGNYSFIRELEGYYIEKKSRKKIDLKNITNWKEI